MCELNAAERACQAKVERMTSELAVAGRLTSRVVAVKTLVRGYPGSRAMIRGIGSGRLEGSFAPVKDLGR